MKCELKEKKEYDIVITLALEEAVRLREVLRSCDSFTANELLARLSNELSNAKVKETT